MLLRVEELIQSSLLALLFELHQLYYVLTSEGIAPGAKRCVLFSSLWLNMNGMKEKTAICLVTHS